MSASTTSGDLLGHTDTRMLERVYRHPVTKTVDTAADPMARLFDVSESNGSPPFGSPRAARTDEP